MDRRQLPEGWKVKKLGEVINLEYGKPLSNESRNVSGKYPAYGANGVKCWSDEYYFDKPSIIVGRKGSAGEVNLTTERFWPLDVTYFVTYDDTQYDLIFLYHCLKHLQLTKLAKGVKPGVNRNDVYQIKFLFPPLDEQKQIVAILDEAFEGINQAIRNTEKNLANAHELFESFLNFKLLPIASGHLIQTLACITDLIVDCEHKTAPTQEVGIPSIRTPNIGKGYGSTRPMR
jgi:type I restriction enzyme S subunit